MLHLSTEPTSIFDYTDPAEIKERNWLHRCVKSKVICTIGPASRSVEVLWYDIYIITAFRLPLTFCTISNPIY